MADRGPSERFTWWRVEIDGDEMRCTIVYEADANTANVFFVRAASEETAKLAGRAAFNLYYRDRLRLRRSKLRTEGKCQCGRARNRGGSLCSVCLQANNNTRARNRLRSQGVDVPSPDKGETLRARRADEREELRLAVLDEVEQVWRKLGTVGFRVWLDKERAKLRKGRAA